MGFETVLIANRGEIARRIIRTARALGLRTVAVYSEPDASAPHVREADDAFALGGAAPGESYLDAGKLLAAAEATGCDAVHPGYGFLSENGAFAASCEAAGLVFVGPPAPAIDAMGNKAAARKLMAAAGVPCVPGYDGDDRADAALREAASAVGYPLMVKAAAGGGGRGMRVVPGPELLDDALALARAESRAAFGSDELILERAIVDARHVEIQVMADAHGAVIHLGERDCSIQRRHQKIIEEAPCPVLDGALRERMGKAAVTAARAIDYRGAGTVEFLLDADGAFYFLEMNTRLQVEHPVTEAVTGLDLVALQFRVAAGYPLGVAQEDVRISGHAIEARLYAEDAAKDFLPASGPVYDWRAPAGEGIRVDAGIDSGFEVSPFYDPLLAKIIAWGETRDEARRRLREALGATVCFGLTTNRDFLIAVADHPVFAAGEATTRFLDDNDLTAAAAGPPAPEALALGAVIDHILARDDARARAVGVAAELLDWHSGGAGESRCRYGGNELLRVRPDGDHRYAVSLGDHRWHVTLAGHGTGVAQAAVDGRRCTVRFARVAGRLHLSVDGRSLILDNTLGRPAATDAAGSDGRVPAPMHGVLQAIDVNLGDTVATGDRLCTLEAMKMQHELRAPVDGRVTAIGAAPGDQVTADTLLFEIEPEES